jgi:hypothetical protein
MEEVFARDSRADYGRHRDAAANGIHFVGFRRLARGDAGEITIEGHTVDEKKLRGLRRFSDVNIGSDRVRSGVSSSRQQKPGYGLRQSHPMSARGTLNSESITASLSTECFLRYAKGVFNPRSGCRHKAWGGA